MSRDVGTYSRRSVRHGERGQILPLWGAATITTFTLMFLLINYGNTVRYQIRAQNAADAAAQALMAVQTQRFNELTAALYASNVEEFRTRLLLDGMLQSLNGAAGCGGQPTTGRDFATGTGSCPQTYNQLLFPYIQSVNRYTTDVTRVNDIATQATYLNWQSDMSHMLTHLSSANACNTIASTASTVHPDGGDCAFKYSLNGSGLRTGLNAVSSDAYIVFVPTQGFTLNNNAENENAQLFDPGMVDVVVCTKVQPLIPVFAALNAKPHYVIGRAGATATLVENDWLQPGALKDQARSPMTLFQPPETYATADVGLPYDWYGVLFGGNSWVIAGFPDPKIAGKTDYGYESYPVINDMSAYAGWWNAIPYDPRKVDSAPVNTTQECPP